MLRGAILFIGLVLVGGCGSAPAPAPATPEDYAIAAEVPDPATGGLTVSLQFKGQPSEPYVRAVAESVIAARREQRRSVVVKSYLEGRNPDQPFAVSTLAGGVISHQVNQPASRKIPTH